MAALPDEVNYPYYENIYLEDKAVSDSAENQYDNDRAYRIELEEGLSENQEYLSNIESEKSSLESRSHELNSIEPQFIQYIAQLENQISSLENQIYNLGISINQLQNQSQQVSQHQSSVANQRNAVVSDLSRTESQRDRKLGDVRASEKEIAKLEAGINNRANSLRESKSELTQIQNQHNSDVQLISDLNREISNRTNLLQTKRSQLTSINSQLSSINSNLSSAKSQLASKKNALESKQEQRKTLALEKAKLNKKLASIPDTPENQAQRNQIKSQISTIESKLSTLAPQISALIADVNGLEKKVSGLEAQKAPLQAQKNQLSNQIDSIESALASARNQLKEAQQRENRYSNRRQQLISRINSLESEINGMNNSLRVERGRLRNLENQLADLNRECQRLGNHAAQLDGQIQELQRQLNDLGNQINGLDQQRANRSATLNQTVSDLQSQNQQLADLRSERVQNQSRIQEIRDEIPQVNQNISQFEQYLNQARPQEQRSYQEWQSALSITNASEKEYRQRLDLYNSYLAQAQEIGADQAEFGHFEGRSAGEIQTQKVSTALASETSSAVAKLDVKFRAYVRGEIFGYPEGYFNGRSDVGTINESRDRADRDAFNNATQLAESKLRAEFRERYFKQLLASELKNKKISVLEVTPVAGWEEVLAHHADSFEIKSRANSEDSQDLSSSEFEESKRIQTSLDAQIAKLNTDLLIWEEDLVRYASPLTSYEAPKDVKISSSRATNCSKVYKGLSVFVKACKDSFVAQYITNYKSSHKEVYVADFKRLFEEKYEESFQVKRAVGYAKLKQDAYKIAFDKGASVGRSEIADETYQATYHNQYAQYLTAQSNRVEQEEINTLNQHKKTHAVINIREKGISSRSVEKYPYAPGTSFALDLLLKNLGEANSIKGSVLAVVESTSSNIEVDQKEVIVPVVEAKTNAILKDIFLVKIKDTARPSDLMSIKVRLKINDANVYGQRDIIINFSQRIELNPEPVISISYEKTPKLRKMVIPFIIWAYPKNEINIEIAPKFAGLEQAYKVELVMDQSMTKMKTETNLSTGVFGRGQRDQLSFVYKFRKKAKNQELNPRVVVRYRGNIVHEQTLTIKPVGR